VYVCDGSQEENQSLLSKLQQDGRLTKLSKYENW
jgi:phosphoenolpyruvate carboxykinase (GTP)